MSRSFTPENSVENSVSYFVENSSNPPSFTKQEIEDRFDQGDDVSVADLNEYFSKNPQENPSEKFRLFQKLYHDSFNFQNGNDLITILSWFNKELEWNDFNKKAIARYFDIFFHPANHPTQENFVKILQDLSKAKEQIKNYKIIVDDLSRRVKESDINYYSCVVGFAHNVGLSQSVNVRQLKDKKLEINQLNNLFALGAFSDETKLQLLFSNTIYCTDISSAGEELKTVFGWFENAQHLEYYKFRACSCYIKNFFDQHKIITSSIIENIIAGVVDNDQNVKILTSVFCSLPQKTDLIIPMKLFKQLKENNKLHVIKDFVSKYHSCRDIDFTKSCLSFNGCAFSANDDFIKLAYAVKSFLINMGRISGNEMVLDMDKLFKNVSTMPIEYTKDLCSCISNSGLTNEILTQCINSAGSSDKMSKITKEIFHTQYENITESVTQNAVFDRGIFDQSKSGEVIDFFECIQNRFDSQNINHDQIGIIEAMAFASFCDALPWRKTVANCVEQMMELFSDNVKTGLRNLARSNATVAKDLHKFMQNNKAKDCQANSFMSELKEIINVRSPSPNVSPGRNSRRARSASPSLFRK